MAAPSYRLQAQIPAPCEGQLKELSELLEINPSDVVVEALGLFTKAVLEAGSQAAEEMERLWVAIDRSMKAVHGAYARGARSAA